MKKQNGITLASLVITIIVLLILAGISIATITGYDSIPDNAKTAVDSSRQDTTEEQNMVNTLDELLKEHLGILTPLTGAAEVDASGLAKKNTLIKPYENSNFQIVIPKGWAPAILAGSNSTTSLPGEDGSVASIMPADQWENITTEQINKGIVIVDHAITYDNGQTAGTVPDFNEFVWVPMPESEDFARVEWTTPCGYDAEGNAIQGSGTKHYLADEATVNRYWDDQSTTEYTKMVSSVNKYKGFYIGRYEASANGTKAQSKRGQVPKYEVTQTEAITMCNNMHIMYGIEWDSTLNWLNGNATIAALIQGESETEEITRTMELEDIQTYSGYWGGFMDSQGNAIAGMEKIETGTSEYCKANNIYDLSGHMAEWSQENYSTGGNVVVRGGYVVAEALPVATRMDALPDGVDSLVRF